MWKAVHMLRSVLSSACIQRYQPCVQAQVFRPDFSWACMAGAVLNPNYVKSGINVNAKTIQPFHCGASAGTFGSLYLPSVLRMHDGRCGTLSAASNFLTKHSWWRLTAHPQMDNPSEPPLLLSGTEGFGFCWPVRPLEISSMMIEAWESAP